MTVPGEAQQAFGSLRVEDWRQFDEVDVEFHPRLTVLTGANASGKSTLLGLLAKHFNWSRAYSSAPWRSSKTRSAWTNFGGRRRDVDGAEWQRIGEIVYRSGVLTELRVPPSDAANRQQYDVQFYNGMQPVPGLFLTSHRYVSGNYAPVQTIPALFGSADQLFEQFTNEIRTRWLGSWTGRTPQLALKESLIASAVFGEGSASVEGNPEAAAVWLGFQDVLRQVMPRSMGFRRLRVRVPEVIIESESGDFIFDEASGGLTALIELSWQILLRSRNHQAFTVVLDEPENHLHPSLQREILPSLLRAFPAVQFIVATHSPFVVTASPDSAVYVLDYDKAQRVRSRRLDYGNKAASAEDTLKRVLGLESTMPLWAEDKFEGILNRYLKEALTERQMVELRRELEENGLVSEFPSAVIAATGRGRADPGPTPP